MMLDPLVEKTMLMALFASDEERVAIETTAIIWNDAIQMMIGFQMAAKRVWVINDFGVT
jgi:hypothetical protein